MEYALKSLLMTDLFVYDIKILRLFLHNGKYRILKSNKFVVNRLFKRWMVQNPIENLLDTLKLE